MKPTTRRTGVPRPGGSTTSATPATATSSVRSGVAIQAIGRSVGDALAAGKLLLDHGISATVVNCRFVKPLDVDLVCALAEKIPRIITIEENVRQGGFGSAVLETVSENGITGIHMERIGIADVFVEHGPQKVLRSEYGIDIPDIVKAAKRLMEVDSVGLK